jgi:hypothetical protein
MRSRLAVFLLSAALAAYGSGPAQAATKAKKKSKATSTPTPTPTPPPYLRAAGTCAGFEPGHFLILAEVGETGRAFRIDEATSLETRPVRGTRVRVYYVEGPDGPIARRVIPGPAARPTPVR